MKRHSRVVILFLCAWFSIAGVHAQSDSQRAIYDNDATFRRLSGAARLQLQRKFGAKPVSRPAVAPSAFRAEALILAPQVLLDNVLVNDPTLDEIDLANGAFDDAQNETTLLLVPGGILVSAYNDGGSSVDGADAVTGYSVSLNGGSSFIDKGALPVNANGDGGDPVLARSELTGTVFLSTLVGANTSNSGIELFRSTNNGQTYSSPVNAAPGFGGGDFLDKPWMTVDNFPGTGHGIVYLAFQNFSGGGTGSKSDGEYLMRSLDDGVTWVPTGGVQVASTGAEQGAFVVVGIDHVVHVFRYAQNITPERILVRSSNNNGASISGASFVVASLNTTGGGDLGLNGGFRSDSFPRAAVNPVNGNLYCVFADATKGADASDIFFTRSSNNGTNWSAAVRVNDDATGNDQWQPVLTVSPDGTRVFIAWYDRRDDPSNLRMNTFGAIGAVDLASGAVTFCDNFRISNQDFPPYVLYGDYMGDYDQAVADNNTFYYTWGDNRLSNSINTNQADVRLARIPKSGFSFLTLHAVAVTGGNNNGVLGLNECLNLSVTLTNTTCGDESSEITVALASSTSGVVVETGESSIPPVGAGQGRSNSVPFVISTSRHLPCGKLVDFILTVKSASSGTYDIPFQLPVAIVSTNPPAQFNNGASITIADRSTVESPVFPSGLAGIIANVVVSVYVQHTFDADLTMSLVAPDGTEVELTSGNGGGGDNYGSACNNRTIFSDAAATSITAGTAPFVGIFRPQQALSALNGKDPNGEWKLRIVDGPSLDSGTFRCWSLFLTTGNCGSGTGPCVTRPDVCLSADALDFGLRPFGTVSPTQSLIITNCGTAPLTISDLFFVLANADDFSIVDENCIGESIPVDGICRVDITYSPTTEGVAEAALIILDDTFETFHYAFMDGRGIASQPDALISRRRNANTFVGNDVYNTTGDFQQSSSRARAGAARRFYVRYQNDGISADRFLVQGSDDIPEGISVRYFLGALRGEGVEITDAVKAGTFSTSTLAPGATSGDSTLIRVEVSVDHFAAIGFYPTTIKFTSTTNPASSDTVIATVAVR